MKHCNLLRSKKGLTQGYLVPYLTVVILVALVILSFITLFYTTKENRGALIADDIALLAGIFERIEKTSDIIGFDYQKNIIDFLTIKKNGFVGSEVGSMNLAHPERWDGPYVRENLTMQGIAYMVVKTKNGYFITPGDGVVLPNGKQIGKDIILNEKADIPAMMRDEKALLFEGRTLAAPVNIRVPVHQGFMPEEMASAQQEWSKINS